MFFPRSFKCLTLAIPVGKELFLLLGPNTNGKSVELVQYTYELGVNTLILLENKISRSIFLATLIMVHSLFHIFKEKKKISLKRGCVVNCLTCVVQVNNI